METVVRVVEIQAMEGRAEETQATADRVEAIRVMAGPAAAIRATGRAEEMAGRHLAVPVEATVGRRRVEDARAEEQLRAAGTTGPEVETLGPVAEETVLPSSRRGLRRVHDRLRGTDRKVARSLDKEERGRAFGNG